MIKKQIYTHLINNEKMYEDFIDKNLSVYMYEGDLYKKMFSKVLDVDSQLAQDMNPINKVDKY
jgi:hypothetical protein